MYASIIHLLAHYAAEGKNQNQVAVGLPCQNDSAMIEYLKWKMSNIIKSLSLY